MILNPKIAYRLKKQEDRLKVPNGFLPTFIGLLILSFAVAIRLLSK